MPLPDADPRAPSAWEPVGAMRRVPIHESDDPLIDFRVAFPDLLIDRPRFLYRRETLLRASVAERLGRADAGLRPVGLRLAIVEGWRAPHIQTRMYRAAWNWWKERRPEWSDGQLRRTVNRFTAPVGDRRVPPPHTTGGAVDLMLVDTAGNALDHAGPYEVSDPRGYPTAARGLTESAQRTRQTLADALESTGLTNYPSEYWHWSWGDQGWAYRSGHPNALYDTILPTPWTPDPADLIDAPLVRLG